MDESWKIPEERLSGALSAAEARDLMVECFWQAQREAFGRAAASVGGSSLNDVRQTIVTVVKMAFESAGGQFERPTKQMLERVLPVLVAKAGAFGTPADIVEHHEKQIMNMIALLPN